MLDLGCPFERQVCKAALKRGSSAKTFEKHSVAIYNNEKTSGNWEIAPFQEFALELSSATSWESPSRKMMPLDAEQIYKGWEWEILKWNIRKQFFTTLWTVAQSNWVGPYSILSSQADFAWSPSKHVNTLTFVLASANQKDHCVVTHWSDSYCLALKKAVGEEGTTKIRRKSQLETAINSQTVDKCAPSSQYAELK